MIEQEANHSMHGSDAPSTWILRFAPLVAAGSRLLDLACGRGRHARLFASRGASVVAVDRDAAAIESLAAIPNVTARILDLEGANWPLAGEAFDAIVVSNYLHRPRLHALLDLLAPDGLLLYETFAAGNEAFGRPSNPAFLLVPEELLALCHGRLDVIAFEQGHVRTGGRDAVVQRVAATGRARRWPPLLP